MALYIKPPKGNINLNKLYFLVKKRFLFLQFIRGKSSIEITKGIEEEKLVDGSDCLIEGSIKDKVSHFVLRLLCAPDSEMRSFLIQSETELFIYRLEFYSFTDVKNIMLHAYNQSKEVLRNHNLLKSYKHILLVFMQLYQDLQIALQKNQTILKVPFICALNFVQERLYPLHSGYLHFPIRDLKILLVSLFENILTQSINQMNSSSCLLQANDPRIFSMRKELKAFFKSSSSLPFLFAVNKRLITEKCLNLESEKFPPCMKHIHNLLRKSHRLQHHARIQYILFLKEIGMPYQEVIELFMKEYSFPINHKSSCSHAWNDNKNRYIYNIEHLYGKRGSSKNYRAHSCYSLQSCSANSVYGGGCPFAVFDTNHIDNFLRAENLKVQDIEDIKSLSSCKKYAQSCCTLLSKKLQLMNYMTYKDISLASTSKTNILRNHTTPKYTNLASTSNTILMNNMTSEDTTTESTSKTNIDKSCFKTKDEMNCDHTKLNNNLCNISSKHLNSILSRPSDFYIILCNFDS